MSANELEISKQIISNLYQMKQNTFSEEQATDKIQSILNEIPRWNSANTTGLTGIPSNLLVHDLQVS